MYFTKFIIIIVILLKSGASIANQYKPYDKYKLYRVLGNKIAVQKLLKYSTKNYDVPFNEHRISEAQILLPPEATESFEEIAHKYHLNATVVIDDVSELIRLEKRSRKGVKYSWDSYYDIAETHDFLKNTHKKYQNSTELIVGGKSYEGRQILGLRINTPGNIENKPVMFIESGIHAREWITPATTTYFINQLLTNKNEDIAAIRDAFDWRIFPVVNPDGYHYSHTTDRYWRKTRSKSSSSQCYGTDPNRNWDYKWMEKGTSSDPCEEVYGGASAFSETETSSLSEYISGIKGLLGYIAFHSDAQMLLLPYSDSKEHLENYDDLVVIGKKSLEYGRAVNGEEYGGPGSAAEILYAVSGGSMDWVKKKLQTPLVFTYELRGTQFHWPPERIPEQGDEVTQIMLGLTVAAKELGYC